MRTGHKMSCFVNVLMNFSPVFGPSFLTVNKTASVPQIQTTVDPVFPEPSLCSPPSLLMFPFVRGTQGLPPLSTPGAVLFMYMEETLDRLAGKWKKLLLLLLVVIECRLTGGELLVRGLLPEKFICAGSGLNKKKYERVIFLFFFPTAYDSDFLASTCSHFACMSLLLWCNFVKH